MNSSLNIHQEIPSNKFYPPKIADNQTLFRSSLIRRVLPCQRKNKKIILIEGQAGQGKSVLAAQFLEHHKLRFAWYQLGPEDTDPVLLLAALVTNLCQRLPGFESALLSRIMQKGEIGPLDLKRCANLLLSDLDRYLAGDFYLVFDDLHRIEKAELTLNLLDHLIDTSPPRLHFLLISRRRPALNSKTLLYSSDVSFIANEDLNFSTQEIEELFNRILQRDIPPGRAQEIRDFTGGWIMGILLAAHPFSGSGNEAVQKWKTFPAHQLTVPQMRDYFRDEIFVQLPDTLHIPLMHLCFLEEIPVELAAEITGRQDIGTALEELMRDNFFLYPLDDQLQTFRFHHLFQEFLQYRARKILSEETIRRIYSQAARYYLGQGAIEKGLACLAAEKNYAAMEALLEREGLQLQARNRTMTLLNLLQSIPEEQLKKHGWLCLFCGLVFSDFFPKKTLPFLEEACCRFSRQGEEVGELLALVQIIYFHFVVSGLYHTGAKLLPRTEELFNKHQKDLPLHARIMVARNLAAGYCFFNSQMDQARHYASLARDLSLQHDIHNCIASTRFIYAYTDSLRGRPTACLQEIELSYPLLHDPLVGMSNKLTLRVLHLNFLAKFGDFLNYTHQQQLLRETIDPRVVSQTVAAPYLYVWGCACLVGAGKLTRAEELLQQGMNVSDSARIPHMRSQFRQWQAYIHALNGKHEQALAEIREAGRLREISGGPFYEAVYLIIAGATYSRTNCKDEALTCFAVALERAEQIPSEYLTAAARLHRAWCHLHFQDEESCLHDLCIGLALMEKNRYKYFWSWEPSFISELLSLAVRKSIMADYALRLSRERLHIFFDAAGNSIPLLRISILGCFRIKLHDRVIISSEQFTPAQREVLGLLLSSRDQRLSLELIKLSLWPDSPPDKARAKLDTLLMRLRKALQAVLPVPVRHYLTNQRGFLCLKNCRIDAVEFMELANRGLRYARQEKTWQAGNCFHAALSLWQGCMETAGLTGSQIQEYRDQLTGMLARIAYTWAVNLAETNYTDEAIKTLTFVLQHINMDDRLITLLYRLYIRNGDMLKAKDLLKKYRRTLRSLEFDAEQIEDLLFQVVSSVP